MHEYTGTIYLLILLSILDLILLNADTYYSINNTLCTKEKTTILAYQCALSIRLTKAELSYQGLWVLVSGRVRGSQDQRLDRTVERSKKRESERTKRKGGGKSSQTLSFPTPHFYLCYLIFYWLIIQQNVIFTTKHCFSFFARSSSFRNNLAISIAPSRSVNRYDGLICFCASGLFQHHLLHQAVRAP
jgi:hypothetical protein